MLKWTIGGIALEFYQRLGQRYGTGKADREHKSRGVIAPAFVHFFLLERRCPCHASDTNVSPGMPSKSERLCVTSGRSCRIAAAAIQASLCDTGRPLIDMMRPHSHANKSS